MAMEDQIKEMEAAGDVKGLEAAKENAGITYEGDIQSMAEQALARLSAKAESAVAVAPDKLAQVESMGGSAIEITEKTKDIHTQVSAVEAEAAAQIDEVQAQTAPAPERPPVPPMPEKKAEGEDVEKLRTELEAQEKKCEEILAEMKKLDDSRYAIMDGSGYNKQLILAESTKMPTERILASLLPNKKIAMDNLNKLLEAASHSSDKERIRNLIQKIGYESDQNLKDLSQNLTYEWMGVKPVNLKTDSFDYDDLGRITGSDEVAKTVKQVKESSQKVADIQNKIANDPALIAIEEQRAILNKQLVTEGGKRWNLVDKISQLESKVA
jgi:hypothetical protein